MIAHYLELATILEANIGAHIVLWDKRNSRSEGKIISFLGAEMLHMHDEVANVIKVIRIDMIRNFNIGERALGWKGRPKHG